MLVAGNTLGVRFRYLGLNATKERVGDSKISSEQEIQVMQTIATRLLTYVLLLSFMHAKPVAAEEAVKEAPAKAKQIKSVETAIARGALTAQIPEAWKKKKPSSRILDHEFAVAPAKGDENAGRLTMMLSGGTIKMNVDRWIGQFTQPDKKATKDVAKVTEKKSDDMKVTVVDISGNFKESVGPPFRRQTVDREDYRMFGAIVQAKPFGSRAYFLKLYGPKKTMAEAEKPFMAMVESLKLK